MERLSILEDVGNWLGRNVQTQSIGGDAMQTILMATAHHGGLMATMNSEKHSGGSGSSSTKEVSLADGTGEGTAPMEGTSASADPEVLSGAAGAATTTSLNDDDYPENISEGAGAVDDGSENTGLTEDSDAATNRQQPSGTDNTSGQAAMPDEAAGVDLRNGSAIPDNAPKK
jgi:hypothetical protein